MRSYYFYEIKKNNSLKYYYSKTLNSKQIQIPKLRYLRAFYHGKIFEVILWTSSKKIEKISFLDSTTKYKRR